MNFLDIIILIVIVFQVIWWWQKGFVRGVPTLFGFWLGAFCGALIAPFVIEFLGVDPAIQLLVALLIIFTPAFVGESLGRSFGHYLHAATTKLHIQKIDSLLGSIFSVIMTLAIVWLLAAIVSGLPSQSFNRAIRSSTIIQALNNTLPPPPEIASQIARIIDDSGFPQVFIGLEPRPIEPVEPPSSAELAAAIDKAGRSTVRVEASGCGGIMTGSGFVVAPGLVVTNAHVIAGVERPHIVDINGTRSATPVVFDADLDIAILRADNLAGDPLELANATQSRGTTAVALGYPGGGPLEADAASVLRSIEARGRNIYGTSPAIRPVYELQTTIDQGNSGGPVVRSDGTVVGVIFARSVSEANVGYAVTSPAVAPLLQQAQLQSSTVSTQSCL